MTQKEKKSKKSIFDKIAKNRCWFLDKTLHVTNYKLLFEVLHSKRPPSEAFGFSVIRFWYVQ